MDKNQLKKLWSERPLEVVAVGAAAVTAVAKVLDVASSARSRNAYARQINRKNRRK